MRFDGRRGPLAEGSAAPKALMFLDSRGTETKLFPSAARTPDPGTALRTRPKRRQPARRASREVFSSWGGPGDSAPGRDRGATSVVRQTLRWAVRRSSVGGHGGFGPGLAPCTIYHEWVKMASAAPAGGRGSTRTGSPGGVKSADEGRRRCFKNTRRVGANGRCHGGRYHLRRRLFFPPAALRSCALVGLPDADRRRRRVLADWRSPA